MIIQKKKGFLDGTWEEACCRSTPTWEGWTARHMGEATGELSEIKWRVRNPPIRESHVAGATEKKVQKMKEHNRKSFYHQEDWDHASVHTLIR